MKKINLIVCIAFCLLLKHVPLMGQSPYGLSWKLDAPMAGVSLGLNATSFLMERQLKPLSPAEYLNLNRQDVWAIDRSATYNWSPTAAKISDGFLIFGILSPTLLFLDKEIRKDALTITTMGLQTIALSNGLTTLTKNLVKRARPFMYNIEVPNSYKDKKDARLSFFSGHTSATAAMSFFTAKVYHDYHPGDRSRLWVWGGAALVPAVTGYLRWKAGKHYFTDIITGYVIGALVGIIVPELHKRIR